MVVGGLLGYWVIGLLGYWVIGLLGYWVIEDRGICEGVLALEHVLGGFDGRGRGSSDFSTGVLAFDLGGVRVCVRVCLLASFGWT